MLKIPNLGNEGQTFVGLCVILACGLYSSVANAQPANDVPLHGNSVVHFASLAESKNVLGKRDTFIQAMSRFDRQCRMNTAVEPTDEELLRFLAAQAMPWEPQQMQWLEQRILSIRQKIAPLQLSLPPQVVFVQTSGKEEGNAAYCRYPAVILPQQVTRKGAEEVERLLMHELFHIMSVHNASFRQAMYRLIGFQTCEEIELPQPFAARKLTNPDSPTVNCWIDVDVNGKRVPAAPLLYASAEQFDPGKGGSLFTYLQFRLVLLEKSGDTFRPIMQGDMPIMVDPKKLPSFYDQIGRNTDYIIHPDEILADNFTFMVQSRPNLATPLLIDRMRQVISGARPSR